MGSSNSSIVVVISKGKTHFLKDTYCSLWLEAVGNVTWHLVLLLAHFQGLMHISGLIYLFHLLLEVL